MKVEIVTEFENENHVPVRISATQIDGVVTLNITRDSVSLGTIECTPREASALSGVVRDIKPTLKRMAAKFAKK